MTPILTAANMIDGTNAVKSKSTQKSELNQGFGQEFSRALANATPPKSDSYSIENDSRSSSSVKMLSSEREIASFGITKDIVATQNPNFRNLLDGIPASAGKLRDNDMQIKPLKPDTEKSESISSGKLVAETNDTRLPVRKGNDDEVTSSGDVSAMLLALQWMHADPVKPPSGDETKNNIDPGTTVTSDPLSKISAAGDNSGQKTDSQATTSSFQKISHQKYTDYETPAIEVGSATFPPNSATDSPYILNYDLPVVADPLPPTSHSETSIGKNPGVQVTADPIKQSADPAVSYGTDPGTQVTADPKSDVRNRLDNTIERHHSLRNDDTETTRQSSALNSNGAETQTMSGQTSVQPIQAAGGTMPPKISQQQNKLAEQTAPATTTSIPVQTTNTVQAEVVRAFTNSSGIESSAQKKAADRSAAQSADIALKHQSDAEKIADTETQAAVKAEVVSTRLDNKFRAMLDEFRLPKPEVNSRSGDTTNETTANTVRNFGDTIRTPENFQTVSQQITQPNRIPVKVGHDGWNAAIGQHMLRMSAEQMKTAELELNPPELGPLKVVLDLQSDQLSTTFVTGSAQVQQALEASVPRLQEMMSQAGYQLSQVNVQTSFSDGQREAQQQQAQFTGTTRPGSSASVVGGSSESAPDIAIQRTQNQRQGGVDMFV